MELQNSITNYQQVATDIKGYLKKSATNFYKIGVKLKEVYEFKAETEIQENAVKKEFDALVEMLPFEKATAMKFIQIANDPFIKKYLDIVPSAYTTMYDLVGLDQNTWNYLEEKKMNSFTTLSKVKELKKQYNASTEDPSKGTKVETTDDNPVDPPKTASDAKPTPDTSELKTEAEETTTSVDTSTESNASEEDADDTMQYFESLAGDDYNETDYYSLVTLSIDPTKVKGNNELVAKLNAFMETATELAKEAGVTADVDEDVFYTVDDSQEAA